MSREIESAPLVVEKQRATMASLGFALVPETDTTRSVEWRGNGITVALHPQEAVTVETVMPRIVETAIIKGAEDVRDAMKKALGFRS